MNTCSFSTLQLFYGFRRLLQCWVLVQFCFHRLFWDAVNRRLLDCVAGIEEGYERAPIIGLGWSHARNTEFFLQGWSTMHSEYFEACVDECCLQDGRQPSSWAGTLSQVSLMG